MTASGTASKSSGHSESRLLIRFTTNPAKADSPFSASWTIRFYAYRYEGQVSDCEKAVVLLCYSEKSFGNPDALRVFISTQTNLSTQEILEMYAKRWSIEVFFRNCKQKLAFDKCQLRKQQGIERMWLILSLVHFLCCTLPDYRGAFEKGFAYFRECLLQA